MERLGSPDPAHPSVGTGPIAGLSVAKTAGIEAEEAVGAGSSKLFWCACITRWLPLTYREELYHVLRLTGPLLLARILYFLLPFVITIFCGHIGNAELAGYALASATINVTTTATGFGLAVACDTLISQTFGGKNMKYVGVILQRSSLILLLFCLPCWALLINSYNLLLLLHQEDEVARIAHLYVMMFLPAVPAMFLHNLQGAYLQNQGIILPQIYTAAAANIFNLAANYVLIFSLQLGVIEEGSVEQGKKREQLILVQLDKYLSLQAFDLTNQVSVVSGSAIANSLSQVTICLLLFCYIRWKKLHQQTWDGWSTDCLQDWDSYMKLAIPSFFMICFEWWMWEIGGFLAGMLGEVDLGAHHVLVEIGAITYMFPLGVHAATCVRVGNALGAGNTTRAIITCKVALVLSGVLAVVQGIIIACYKSVVGYIFTSDENIVKIVSENLTVYIFLQFFDALLCVCSGILIGSGMQKLAAISNLVAYYCIGMPIGIALMFTAKLRVLGLWLGLFICAVFEAGLFLIIIFRLNWKKVTHKAQLRAGKKVVLTQKHPVSVVLNEEMVPDISDCHNTAQIDGEENPKADGYRPVNTQDQEQRLGHATEGKSTIAGVTEGGDEQSKNTSGTKPQVLLSLTQLILRRGLTLLVSLLILAVGVAFHIAFPIPEPIGQNRANFTLKWVNDSTPTPLAPLELTPNI